MAGTKIKLSVRNARKTYGPVHALVDASFDMREGEFVTLLGPSGSGKTTLLMIVAGLTQPSGGEVWIDGKLATYTPPNKRDIGIVFQNYALFPHLTVFENIAFPLRMRQMPEARIAEEVTRVLEIVQLGHTAKRLPRELSGGQQQRIALARCTVYRPSIILMDEPLGALDRKLRDQMQLEIKHLHTKLGITVLYVTHDQDEAMTMSDRICLMNNGLIEQIGAPQELYFQPRSVFVADFLGESNLLPATVLENGRTIRLEAQGGLRLEGAGGGFGQGERVRVMVRPESLRLLAPGEQAANLAEGTLKEVVFMGGIRRYYVALPGDVVLTVKQLTVTEEGARSPGERVRVGWERERTVVLPESGRGAG